MESDTTKTPQSEPAFSRPFAGKPKHYFWVSVAVSTYLSVGIYLFYALVRYYFAGDADVFTWQVFRYALLFWLLYTAYSYRSMMKYDGAYADPDEWVEKEVTVKLLEPKEHRRFG